MRLTTLALIGLAAFDAAPAWSAVQVQAALATCQLPPPLVCPPEPPPGPKTVTELDAYIKDLDEAIRANSSAQSSGYRPFSKAAADEIKAYVGELEGYRKEVVDYRDRINIRGGRTIGYEAAPEK